MKVIAVTLLVLILLTLTASSFYLFGQMKGLRSEVEQVKISGSLEQETMRSGFGDAEKNLESGSKNLGGEGCGDVCRAEVQKAVVEAVAKITITPVIANQTASTSRKQVSYANLGSTATTMSTDWVTIDDSEIVLDLVADYGTNATVSWEASLKVAYGNGTAYARLYDVTHNIAVDGSELSVDNTQSFVQKTSKNLPFWRGRNTYKVQIKSLNGFEVAVSGGRLKIQY